MINKGTGENSGCNEKNTEDHVCSLIDIFHDLLFEKVVKRRIEDIKQ